MKKFLVGLVVGALLASGAAYGVKKYREAGWQEKINAANERARHYALQYREVSRSWHDLAIQTSEQDSLLKVVRQENEALADKLEQAGARISSLTRTRTRLQAKLDSSRTTVERDTSSPNTLVVNLDEQVVLSGGGGIRVYGPVRVETTGPSVRTALEVEGSFPLTVVISRHDNGEVGVDAFTGDPRLTVTQLDVVQEATPPPASGFSFAGVLSDQVFSLGPWLNRAVGAAACLAVR